MDFVYNPEVSAPLTLVNSLLVNKVHEPDPFAPGPLRIAPHLVSCGSFFEQRGLTGTSNEETRHHRAPQCSVEIRFEGEHDSAPRVTHRSGLEQG